MNDTLPFTPDPNTAHPGIPAHMVQIVREWPHLRPSSWTPLRTVGAPPALNRWSEWPDEPEAIHTVQSTFTYHRARGAAAYVGDPFVWEWEVAVDGQGRHVATDSHPLYLPRDPMLSAAASAVAGEVQAGVRRLAW